MSKDAVEGPANAVLLRGRVSGEPQTRILPSGTRIVWFRVVVQRAVTAMTTGSQQKSDWMDCAAWSGRARRSAGRWRVGDVVEVEGALRRRHYRSGAVSGSRVEVEMLGGRLLSRAPAQRPDGRDRDRARDQVVPG